MIAIRAAAATHTGYVRSNNEDQAVVSSDLVAVADGVGGHLGGEVAAQMAIDELVAGFRRDRTADGLVSAVTRANASIWRRSRVDRSLHGMGTTLTAVALVTSRSAASAGQQLTLVHVGDSRAYQLERSENGSPALRQLTEDHSVVEEMVRSGEITPAEAAVHPHRNVLTRVVGTDAEVEPDSWDLELEAGARFLLCSDGLTNEVQDPEIAVVLTEFEDAHASARELVGRALGHGGIDNVTVVVVDVVETDAPQSADDLLLVPARADRPGAVDEQDTDFTQALPVAGPAAEDGGPPTQASPLARPEGLEARQAVPARRLTGGAHSRRARSMTMRALPSETSEAVRSEESLARQSRQTVLVSTKELSKQYRDRIVTFRVFCFVLLLAGLLAGMIAAVVWFQRQSYYVGLDGHRISIYEGRKGGLLWFKPQLLETSQLTTSELLPNSVVEIEKGITESSYRAAKRELLDLVRLSHELGLDAGRNASSKTAVNGGGSSP